VTFPPGMVIWMLFSGCVARIRLVRGLSRRVMMPPGTAIWMLFSGCVARIRHVRGLSGRATMPPGMVIWMLFSGCVARIRHVPDQNVFSGLLIMLHECVIYIVKMRT
jgi:hypothetical protein